MSYRFQQLCVTLVLVMGFVVLPLVAQATTWTCSATGNTFNSPGTCASMCSPSACNCNGSPQQCGQNPFATADTPYPRSAPPNPAGPLVGVNDALGILVSVIELAQVVFWILTVGFGLYGAYLYLFSAGNKEQAAQARKVFIYTVVAGLLAIISYGIPGIVEGFIFGF